MKHIPMTLDNGNTVDLTINMGALLELRSVDESLYSEYFDIYNKMKAQGDDFTELDMYSLIYIAYRCGSAEQTMSKIEFLKEMPDSRKYAGEIFKKLYGVVDHQKKAFQNHSKRRHEKGTA